MKQRTKHYLIAFLCLLSLLALSLSLGACGIVKKEKYSVTIADYDTTYGKVTLSPESEDGKYEKDTEITVTVEAYEGYALDTFRLSTEDRNVSLNNEGKFIFNVKEDTIITVTFKSTVVPVESVTLGSNTLELEVGGRTEDAIATLVANVQPDNATDKTVTWTSSNPAVATVEGGNVTALTAGETTITATAGGKSATCTVTVTQHTHTAAAGAQWQIDSQKGTHYKECVCGAHVEEAAHVEHTLEEVPATCTTKGKTQGKDCSVCGEILQAQTETDMVPHKAAEDAEWQKDPQKGTHYKLCATCNEAHVEEAAHAAKDDKWHQDVEEHYKECVCGEHVEFAEHYNEDDEYVSDGATGHHQVCTACEASFNQGRHELESEYTPEEGGHYQECFNCDYHTDLVPHTNPNPDGKYTWYKGEHNAKYHGFDCPVCEFAVRIDHSNSYKYDYSQDDGEYFYCDECDMPHQFSGVHLLSDFTSNDNGTHTVKCSHPACTYEKVLPCSIVWTPLEDAASGHKGVCSECSYTVEREDHAFNDDKECSKCGYKDRGSHVHKDKPDQYGFYDGLCDDDDEQLDNPVWTVSGSAITAYNGSYEKLRVPAKIAGVDITELKAIFKKVTCTDIIVADSITKIAGSLFAESNSLKTVILGEGLTALQSGIFNKCTALTAIIFKASTIKFTSSCWGIKSGSTDFTPQNMKVYFNMDATSLKNAINSVSAIIQKYVNEFLGKYYCYYNAKPIDDEVLSQFGGAWHYDETAGEQIGDVKISIWDLGSPVAINSVEKMLPLWGRKEM